MTWYTFNNLPIDEDRYLVVIHNNIPKIVNLIYVNETHLNEDGNAYVKSKRFLQEATGKRYYIEHHPYSYWMYLDLPELIQKNLEMQQYLDNPQL